MIKTDPIAERRIKHLTAKHGKFHEALLKARESCFGNITVWKIITEALNADYEAEMSYHGLRDKTIEEKDE